MTVALDQMMTVGPLRIMVISECKVTAYQGHGAVFLTGHKRPIAFLIRQGAALDAFGLDGEAMKPKQVETLCPGAYRTALEAR